MRRNTPSAASCAFSAAMRRTALSVMMTARSLLTSDIASDMCCALHLARATVTVYLSTLGTLSKRAGAPPPNIAEAHRDGEAPFGRKGAGHAAGIARRAGSGAGGGLGGQACPASGARAQGAVALDLDDPQCQSPEAEPRRAQGRRPSGVERVGCDADDRALPRCHASAGSRRGQAARRPGIPRAAISA